MVASLIEERPRALSEGDASDAVQGTKVDRSDLIGFESDVEVVFEAVTLEVDTEVVSVESLSIATEIFQPVAAIDLA